MAIRRGSSITVGGLPGTGTTTACRKLAALSNLPYFYAGKIFRDIADERNMTLEAFSHYAEEHPEVDRELDIRQIGLLRDKPVLLEGRLSGFLAHREGFPAFKVWFHADPYVRANRVVQREGGDVEQRMADMRLREASERRRYSAYYGVDMGDLSFYDLVIGTTNRSPTETVEEVWRAYNQRAKPKRWYRFWD